MIEIEELEELILHLKHYRSILENEGKDRYEKTISIVNAYIDFILNLIIEFQDYDFKDESDEDEIVEKIINEIRKFIITINSEIGYSLD